MTVIEVLRLLADGADRSELDALRERTMAAGEVPSAVAAETFELASRVREIMDANSEQNEARVALLESAQQLGDVSTDTELVLQSIVFKARRLLGTDLSYLSLNDNDSSETYFKVMAGAVTDHWRDGRIPFGVGVGGRVAATAAPFWTPEYLDDNRIEHDPYVDATVRGEGQRAIMASPLVHRGRVIGVLFAANRTPGAFPKSSIDLLSACAALAAVAIERSKLFSEMEQAHKDLRASNRALQAQTLEVQRSIEAHDRFMGVVLAGGGMREVVAAAVQSLPGDLGIFDGEGDPIAWTQHTPEDTLHAMSLVAEQRLEGAGRSELVERFWVTRLAAGAEGLGSLVWSPAAAPRAVAEVDQRLLERTSVVASLLMLFRRALGEAESRARGELLGDLLCPTARTFETLSDRARRSGFVASDHHVVLAMQTQDECRQRLGVIAADVAAARQGLSTTRDGLVVVVMPSDDPSELAHILGQTVTRRLGSPVTVGASEPVLDPTEIPRGFEEAAGCVRAMTRLGRTGSSGTSAELGYVGLLIGSTSSAPTFVDRTLGPVIEHDQLRRSLLVETLATYFDTGQSLAASAATLHVHTNTVSQRLNRVKQLLGVDWTDPEHALEIQLALRLHAAGLSSSVSSTPPR